MVVADKNLRGPILSNPSIGISSFMNFYVHQPVPISVAATHIQAQCVIKIYGYDGKISILLRFLPLVIFFSVTV